MKIGILSDSHGSLIQTKKALDAMGDCDLILHLGDVIYHGPRNPLFESYEPAKLAEYLKDKDIVYVKGNCDSDVDAMVTGKDLSHKERLIDLDGFKIYAVHGYEESFEERLEKAKKLGANLLCFGHSHKKLFKKFDGIDVINPGSTSLAKDGMNSCAIYEDGNCEFINLD